MSTVPFHQTTSSFHFSETFQRRRIIITCGTGGVGKTTLSAALGIRAALQGKKTLVITIDPAKRLATALGLPHLKETPTDLTPLLEQALQKFDFPHKKIQGRFFAVIPDTKKNFEDLLKDLSPSPTLVQQILKNPIFQIFTKEFSGTNEYLAMERLQAIDRLREYDLIILDTPPSRNALHFLDAPELIRQFFDERLIRLLVVPSNKLFSLGMKKAMNILEKLTGAGFISNLVDFATSLFELRIRFLANLSRTISLLRSEEVGFMIVSSARSPEIIDEVQYFISTLKHHLFHFEGLIINRSLLHLESAHSPQTTRAEALIHEMIRKEKITLEKLFFLSPGQMPAQFSRMSIPELARDIHSLEDLLYVAQIMEN